MSAPVDVLAVIEAESDRRLSNYNAAVRGDAPEALTDRLHAELHEMATARAAVAELIEACKECDEAEAALRVVKAYRHYPKVYAERNARFSAAVARRTAALARVQGGS